MLTVKLTCGRRLLTGKYKRGHVFTEDDERSGFFDFQGERFNQYCDAVQKLSVIAGILFELTDN